MNKQSGIHFIGERMGAPTPPGLPGEVVRIRDTVVAGLGDLLQGAFDAVDDSLFELANNARSNNEQNRYFEAMREIRIKRKGVEKQFQSAVVKLFNQPPRSGQETSVAAPVRQPTADSLSLVQNDELEEQVALNAMISKARAHFQSPLIQLQTRFSVAYPGESEDAPVNPMAPEHLCNAFASAAEALDIQIRERLIVLKQFDRYVVSNLGMLLDEANRILIQAGIVPNFRYHGKSGEQARQKAETVGLSTGGQPGSATAPSTASSTAPTTNYRGDDAFFEQIRQLLAGQRCWRASAPCREHRAGSATRIFISSVMPSWSICSGPCHSCRPVRQRATSAPVIRW